MNEPTRVLLANAAALEAITACSTPSYAPAAMLLRLRRSPLVAELAEKAETTGPSGVLEELDDHEKANLRAILREAIAEKEAAERAALT
jgi:hypothetical protein